MCLFQSNVCVGHLTADYYWLQLSWSLAWSFPHSSRLGQTLAGQYRITQRLYCSVYLLATDNTAIYAVC